MSEKKCNVNELLALFSDSITPADILAAKIMAQISTAITKERLKLRMNQAQFAQHINASQSLVSRWECGDYNFSVKKIAEIFAALNLDVDVSFCDPALKIQNNVAAYMPQAQFVRTIRTSSSSHYSGKSYIPTSSKVISISTKKEEVNDYATVR